ncbi:MAG TPA: zf-HC2 domain-containing protein [Bryobacteraceae bacterium]|jgi:anti-sigma factor RsiW
MACLQYDPQGAEILMDYCAGKLDGTRSAELEAHIEECFSCKEAVDGQRRLWETLDAWKPVEVSPGFDATLYSRIAAEAERPWWRRALWKPLIPVAAAGVLALALVRMPPSPPAPVKTPVASSDRIDLQQVEQALDDMDMLTPVGQTSSSRL